MKNYSHHVKYISLSSVTGKRFHTLLTDLIALNCLRVPGCQATCGQLQFELNRSSQLGKSTPFPTNILQWGQEMLRMICYIICWSPKKTSRKKIFPVLIFLRHLFYALWYNRIGGCVLTDIYHRYTVNPNKHGNSVTILN